MKRTQRWISLVLCIALVLSVMPTNAFAEQSLLLPNEIFHVSVDEKTEADTVDVASEIDEEAELLSLTETVSGYCGAEGDGTNLTWTLKTDGVLTISGTGTMQEYATVHDGIYYVKKTPWSMYQNNIAEIIVEEGVTSLGTYAFIGCTKVQKLDLPETLKTIGSRVLNSRGGLRDVVIPQNVESIGAGAFSDCADLEYITVDKQNLWYSSDESGVLFDKEKSILIQCPDAIACERYVVPSSVLEINDKAFQENKTLIDVVISDGTLRIGDASFGSCEMLASISIPSSVQSIAETAFDFTPIVKYTVNVNNYFYSSDKFGVLFNKDRSILIAYPGGNTQKTYEIPDGTTTVLENAFSYQRGLQELIIPASVIDFGPGYKYCYTLETFIVDPENRFYSSDEFGVLFDKAKKTLIQCPMDISALEYVIPESVTTINDDAFWQTEIEQITLSDNTIKIGYNAFGLNSWLETITLPKSISTIDGCAFEDCERLECAFFSGNAPEIFGDGVFDSCAKNFTIYYSEGTSGWTDSEYYDAEAGTWNGYKLAVWTGVEKPDDNDTVDTGYCGGEGDGTNLTWTLTADGVLTISGTGVMADFDSDAPWSDYFVESVIIHNGVTTIGKEAFYMNDDLISVSMPNSITIIEKSAFYGCSYLENISFSKSLSVIESSAFEYCRSIPFIELPAGLEEIGNFAFDGCGSMESITIPDSVIRIGNAFSSCENLTVFTVNDEDGLGYNSIDGVLFDGKELTRFPEGRGGDYVIPDGTISIDSWAFVGATKLESVIIPGSVRSIWGGNPFANCSSLKTITVSEDNKDHTSQNGVLFDNSMNEIIAFPCGVVGDYSIPEGVTSIANNSFWGCSGLTNIELPNTIISIGSQAFADCENLNSIIVPASIREIGSVAFHYCSNLQKAYFLGDAPSTFEFGVFEGCADNFTVYYTEGFSGWTDSEYYDAEAGTWNGYKLEAWDGKNDDIPSDNPTAPIVQSITIKVDDKTYDPLTEKLEFFENDKTYAEIEAHVDANGCEDVRLYLTQGAKTAIEIPLNACITVQLGNAFSPGKDIYLLVVDKATSASTAVKTLINVLSTSQSDLLPDTGVSGLNFKLGGEVGFTLPDQIPVFGGTELSWDIDFIPLSIEYDRNDNNKVNIVFGSNVVSESVEEDGIERNYFSDFDFAEYKKDLKEAASKQKLPLGKLKDKFKMEKGKKMSLFGGAILAGGEGSTSGDIDVAGYAELYYSNDEWHFAEGQLLLEATIKYEYQGQIFIWVVPCYYEIGGSAGAGLEGLMTNIDPVNFQPVFDAYLTLKIGGNIGAGIGVPKVATVGASGKAALNAKQALDDDYLKVWVDGEAAFKVKVFGKEVAKENFAEGSYLVFETDNPKGLIPDGQSASLLGMMQEIDIDSVYENEDRDYAENKTVWLGYQEVIELNAVDYTGRETVKIAENIYPDAQPILQQIVDQKVLIMQWDNSNREDADRSMLVYSVYENDTQSWSEPIAVHDDGTADFYPCFQDGWLVWQNTKTKLSDNLTLREIASLGEIYAARWNGNGFDAPVQITNNASIDSLPVVAVEDSNAYVAWISNSENDILCQEGYTSIWQRRFANGTWSEPVQLQDGLDVIIDMDAAMVDSTFCISYVMDEDRDYETLTDREIHLIMDGAVMRITNNNKLDSNPVFAEGMLYYYHDGNIRVIKPGSNGYELLFDTPVTGLTDEFVVKTNGSAAAIWWSKAVDGGGLEIYACLKQNGTWSDAIPLTSLEQRSVHPTGILEHDGSMMLVFTSGIEVAQEIVQTDLYVLSLTPSCDLAIENAYIDEESMKVHAIVANRGELDVSTYTLSLYDGGMCNNTLKKATTLAPGEAVDVELDYVKPDRLTLRDLELTLTTEEWEEYNTANNVTTLQVGHADVSVTDISASDETSEIIAVVSNEGYSLAENISVCLRNGSSEGAILERLRMTLSAGDSQKVSFPIDKETLTEVDGRCQVYVTAEITDQEITIGNNDEYIFLTSDSGKPSFELDFLDYTIVEQQTVVTVVANNNINLDRQLQVCAAAYNEDGAMIGIDFQPVELKATAYKPVHLNIDRTVINGDTIKVFVLDSQTTAPVLKAYSHTIGIDQIAFRQDFAKALASLRSIGSDGSLDIYADTSHIDEACADAVLRMYNLDLMTGDGKNFNPKATVTRAELAKMIYIALNGGVDDGATSYVNENLFSDVTADDWYAGYCNYCVVQKIDPIQSDTYGPLDPVSTLEATRMLLCAMGYSAEACGFVGDNWSDNVLAAAESAGLLDEFNYSTSSYLPRQWLAVMFCNAIDNA